MAISCVEPKNSAIFSGRWHGTEWKWIQESWKYELRWLVLVLTDNEGERESATISCLSNDKRNPSQSDAHGFCLRLSLLRGCFFLLARVFTALFVFFELLMRGGFPIPTPLFSCPPVCNYKSQSNKERRKTSQTSFFFYDYDSAHLVAARHNVWSK